MRGRGLALAEALGEGLGLTDALGFGDGLGLTEALGFGEGLGLTEALGFGEGDWCPRWRPRGDAPGDGRPIGGWPFGLFRVPPPWIGDACGRGETTALGEGSGEGDDCARAGMDEAASKAAAAKATYECFIVLP